MTVRAPPAEHCGRSLSLMLLELAMVAPYGDPARHTAIVKRCDSALDAEPARPHPRTVAAGAGPIDPFWVTELLFWAM